VYEIMWKNMLEPDRSQMTIWRMRITCWIPKSTRARARAHTHTHTHTQTHTHSLKICNTYCFSMAITFSRTRLSGMLIRIVHCLSRLRHSAVGLCYNRLVEVNNCT